MNPNFPKMVLSRVQLLCVMVVELVLAVSHCVFPVQSPVLGTYDLEETLSGHLSFVQPRILHWRWQWFALQELTEYCSSCVQDDDCRMKGSHVHWSLYNRRQIWCSHLFEGLLLIKSLCAYRWLHQSHGVLVSTPWTVSMDACCLKVLKISRSRQMEVTL